MAEKIVIALGGNALQSGKSEATAEARLKLLRKLVNILQISAAKVMKSVWFTETDRRSAEFCWLLRQQKMLPQQCRLMFAALCPRVTSDIICSRR